MIRAGIDFGSNLLECESQGLNCIDSCTGALPLSCRPIDLIIAPPAFRAPLRTEDANFNEAVFGILTDKLQYSARYNHCSPQ
jgi:hypothetical protein